MSIIKHFGHHIKHTALNVHGFFKGMLSGTNTGNNIGSMAGMGVGLALALTGVISGGIIPAIVMGVAIGGIVGMVGGGIIGSLTGGLKDENASSEQQEVKTNHVGREQTEQQESVKAVEKAEEPAPAKSFTQDIPVKKAGDKPVSFSDRLTPLAGTRPDPAHYRTEEEGVDFRHSVVKERLAQVVAATAGITR